MKRGSIVWLIVLIWPSTVYSQAFEKDKSYLYGSYGVAPFFNLFYNLILNSDSLNEVKLKSIGPIYGKWEYSIHENIGLGLNVSFMNSIFSYTEKNQYFNNSTNTNDTYTEHWTITRNTYSIMGRFNYHFLSKEKVDLYYGFGFGYRDAKWKSKYEIIGLSGNNTPPPSSENISMLKFHFAFETTFGVKYLLTPNLGFFAEAGFAKSFFQFGLCSKL